ncbi:MAG: DUF368 domain-containing protein [Oscillospiraceae bacterium]
MKETMITVLKGLAVGASMTVPGVSGGSMAMITGIYDRLVSSMSRIFSEPEQSIPFLLKFSVGAAAGVFLLAGIIGAALGSPAGLPLRFFFLGAVAGGIPLIFRKAELDRLSAGCIALILAGAAAVLFLSRLPEGLFSPVKAGAVASVIQFAGGIIIAAALVLPGISCSHMMLMMGIYGPVMDSISRLDILSLLPMAAGLAVGTFLTARVLERLIEKHGRGCYLVILGFMAGSLTELVPEVSIWWQWLIGGVCTAVGFIAVRLMCSGEIKKLREERRGAGG